MKASKFAFAGLATAFALTACVGPPSNNDAEQAFATLLEESGAERIGEIQDFELTGFVGPKTRRATAATPGG